MREKKANAGLSLVELAIVMVAVGLMIGGVLKGMELVQNARINSTIKEVQSVKSAVGAFRDKYMALPGDFFEADTVLPDCTAANFCLNGDEDGWVGMGSGDGLSSIVSDQPETVQFWKHLAVTDMITGIDTSADWQNPELGVTHPRAAIGGGYEFFYDPNLFRRWPTNVLRLNQVIITPGVDRTTIGAVSPHVAAQIDRKMDDGNSRSGNLIIWEHGNRGCDNIADGTVGQDETAQEPACTLLFKIDE